MSKLEKDGSPREKTPGLICDRERHRGKHKWACPKGTTRECRGAEAICVKACCEWTGYTESVVFAIYTRHPKGAFLWSGHSSDSVLKDSEKTTHPVVHATILADEETCYNESLMSEVETVAECKVAED